VVPVTDTQAQALRAFLDRAVDEMPMLAYELGDAEISGYLYLADAALSLLACRRFPLYSSADVVRYVASIRRERLADGGSYDIDPVVGECVLRSSLGIAGPPQPAEERFRAVIALLGALSATELHTATDVDELLRGARALADQWLAKRDR
jgi:hypothetical protein